jgi:methylmalonyl-CoA mutase
MTKTKDILTKISSLFPPVDETAWRNAAEALLKGKPFEKALLTETIETITLSPIYTESDTITLPFVDSLPGNFPYSRGATASHYHSRNWVISQVVSAPEPFSGNKVLREELEGGTQSINILFDYPTLAGADADVADPTQIGRKGLSLNTIDDLAVLLKDIDIAKYPLYWHCGATNIGMLMLLIAFAKKNEVQLLSLKGVVGADPIGALAETGQLPDSIDRMFDDIAEGMRYADKHQVDLRHFLVRSDIYVDAGADIVTELAAALATGLFYLRNMEHRGFDIDRVAKTMAFQTAIGNHFFMEIAKLRVLRMLWGQILKAFGKNECIGEMFIHTTASKWNKSYLDAHVNILRATTEVLASVLGGANSIAVYPHDFLSNPSGTTFSRRIARNIQHIIREESYFDHVLDPVGGAWYLEKITDELAKKVWQKFQEIESGGGIFEFLATGDLQRKIEAIAANRMESIVTGKTALIGVNHFANADENLSNSINDITESATRIEQIRDYKSKRPFPKIDSDDFSKIIELIENGATIGQITEWRYRDPIDHPRVYPLKKIRAAKPFEVLRQRVATFLNHAKKTPKILLLRYGSLREYQPRCEFSKGFLAMAGLKASESQPVATPNAALDEIQMHTPKMVVFCSSDERYSEFVETVSRAIKQSEDAPLMILAGNPADQMELYRQAGVDQNIFLYCNAIHILQWILERLGIPA